MNEIAQLDADIAAIQAQKIFEARKADALQVRLDNQIAVKQARKVELEALVE